MATRKGNLVSRLTSRSVGISLPSLEEIPEGSLITRKSPQVTEQTRVLNCHPHCNSRMYPRFPPQLEKNHETSPSPRDEAQFPCFVCRPILCSQSDTLVALICLMEFQRDPKNCHKSTRSLMLLHGGKIAMCAPNQLEMKPNSLISLQSHPAFYIIHKWLDFL